MRKVTAKTVTIKALRARGGLIEWCYDTPQECARFWRELCETGRAPDTGDALVSASYFLGTAMKPTKGWDKRQNAERDLKEVCSFLGI